VVIGACLRDLRNLRSKSSRWLPIRDASPLATFPIPPKNRSLREECYLTRSDSAVSAQSVKSVQDRLDAGSIQDTARSDEMQRAPMSPPNDHSAGS